MTAAWDTACKFDLASLMRAHKVTIRQLADRIGTSMKRVREIRAMDRVSYTTYCDWHQAVTGQNIFNRGRYEALQSLCRS